MTRYNKIAVLSLNFILILTIFLTIPVTAEIPSVEWSRTYDVDATIIVDYGTVGYSQSGRSVIQTLDGGYAIVGKTTAFFGGAGYGGRGPPSERNGGVLIKTGSDGALQWYSVFSFVPKYPHSIIQTNDLGFLVNCESGRLLKFNAEGDLQWNRTIINSIEYSKQTSDKGYLVVGTSQEQAIVIIKIDENGNELSKINVDVSEHLPEPLDNYPGGMHPKPFSIAGTDNGGIVAIGTWSDTGAWAFRFNLWLIEIDLNGDLLMQKTYNLFNTPYHGPSSQFRGLLNAAIEDAQDGGFILSGGLSVPRGEESVGYSAPWLAKIDSKGDLEWSQAYANSWWNSSYFVSSVQSQKGYFAVGILGPGLGQTYEQTYPLLLGTDRLGNEEWRLTYHSSWWDSSRLKNVGNANSVIVTNDGGYAVVGSVNGKVWLTKLAPSSTIPSDGASTEPSLSFLAILTIAAAIIVSIISVVFLVYFKKSRRIHP